MPRKVQPSKLWFTEEALLNFFAFSEFPKQVLAQALRPTTKAYVVTRGGFTPDGVYHAFDKLHYYPAASPGHSGFVYYDGLVSGWSEYDHKWYAASAEGDRAMSRFIASRSPSAKAHAHIVGLPPGDPREVAPREHRRRGRRCEE